nr:hypothetical protein [Tanacetum cinerariifolium]
MKCHDEKVYQNSGVSVEAIDLHISKEVATTRQAFYYGVLQEIWTPPKNYKDTYGEVDNEFSTVIHQRSDNIFPCVNRRDLVLTDSSHHSGTNVADDEVTSIVGSSMPPPPVLTVAVTTVVVAGTTSALIHDSCTRQIKPSIFIDSASSSMAEADVAGPSQPGRPHQACFNAEIRMRLEHELRGRQKLKERCTLQVNRLKEKDTKIASLKAELSLKEAEATKAIRLRGQIANVEAVEAAKLSCDELSVKAFSLEFEKYKLIDQVSELKAVCSGLRDKVAGYKLFKEQVEVVWILDHDVNFAIMKCLQSPEYLAASRGALGCGIDKGMQDGLKAGVDHKRARRGLDVIVAYDPLVEANFVSVVGDAAACRMSLMDTMVPLLEPLFVRSSAGEASNSVVLVMTVTTALSTTFVQTSVVPLVPSVEVPPSPKIMFEKE